MRCGKGSKFEKGKNGVRRFWLVYELPGSLSTDLADVLASFAPDDLPTGNSAFHHPREIWRAVTKSRDGSSAIAIFLQSRGPIRFEIESLIFKGVFTYN